MAKVTAPLLSMTASGQLGRAIVFDKRGHVRNYVVPTNPKTVAQMALRNRLGDTQRELKELGLVLQPQLKAALGYRWNALIVGEVMRDDQAKWTAYLAEWTAFQAGEKTAWEGADPGVGLVNAVGSTFYIVAKCLYDVALRVGGDGLITEPAAANAATVGAEWIDDTP
jgi:hypothetical protein